MVTMRERFEEFGFAVNKWIHFARGERGEGGACE